AGIEDPACALNAALHDQLVTPGRLPERSSQAPAFRPRQRLSRRVRLRRHRQDRDLLIRRCSSLLGLLQGILGAKHQRCFLRWGAAIHVHHAQVVLRDLALTGLAPDLADSLDQLLGSARAADELAGGKLAAIGIDREAALVGRVGALKKAADLALRTD